MKPFIAKTSEGILELFHTAFHWEFDLQLNYGTIFVAFDWEGKKYRHIYEINLKSNSISASTWHDIDANNSERLRNLCVRFDIEDEKAKNKVRKFLKDYCINTYGYNKTLISKL